jgi:hypothetical protein
MRKHSLHVSMPERFNIYQILASWWPKVRLGLRIRMDQSRCVVLLIERCLIFLKLAWKFV